MAAEDIAICDYWLSFEQAFFVSQSLNNTNTDVHLRFRVLRFVCSNATVRGGNILITNWQTLADETDIKSDPDDPNAAAPALKFVQIHRAWHNAFELPMRVIGSPLVHFPFDTVYVGEHDSVFVGAGEVAIQVNQMAVLAEQQRALYTEALRLMTLGRETV